MGQKKKKKGKKGVGAVEPDLAVIDSTRRGIIRFNL